MTDNTPSDKTSTPSTLPGVTSAEPITPFPAEPERSGGRGLGVLALLVALAALGVAGWMAWQLQLQRAGIVQQQTRFESAASEAQQQAEQSRQLAQQVRALPTADQVAEQRRLLLLLQGDQQSLAQGLAKALGNSREAWRLGEAEHLVRLAMLRLSALQDINSATQLLEAADDIIRAQDDPLAFAARGELIKALEALRALPHPDRNGLFLQLAALRQQVDGLQSVAPEFVLEQGTQQVALASSQRPWWDWQRWRDQIAQYVRLDLRADQDIRPQLSGQTLAQVRLTLSLALEQAQWGALNAQDTVYHAAVRQAREVLGQYFKPDDSLVISMDQRLGQLSGQIVAVDTPDLRPVLTRLESYVQARERQDDGAPAASTEAPAAPAQTPAAQGDGA